MDSDDELSYSFYMDNLTKEENLKMKQEDPFIINSPPDPFPYTKRTREKWVENNSITHCSSCKATFRIYRRRHHCRFCSQIFCDYCSSYREKIPKVIKKIPTRSGKEELINYEELVRLCLKCHGVFTSIHKLDKLFTVFSFLKLDIKDYKNLCSVNKQWNLIGAFYLSKFREIQYKLPRYSYNSWEKQALWTNRFILKNHSLWEVHVLRSVYKDKDNFSEAINLYFPKDDEKTNCWNRMCSRFCKNKLCCENSLLLLDILGDNKESDLLCLEIEKVFDQTSDYILECYLPYILHKMIISRNIVLKNFIIKRCLTSIRIANCCYCYLKNESNVILAELLEQLPQKYYATIIKTQNFVEMVKNDEILPGKIISILNPELGEQEIYIDKISVKQSATRPTLIPCDKSSILFKKDDIRKDYIIMCIIRLMEKILKDSGLDIDIVTYNVQPTSSKEGFIKIVDNCETLYSIEKLETTIINYLLDHNPTDSVSKLRQKFKNSCAVYSVIAFLLSISDRNTENLLVTEDSQLFHIDYSYCLGADPKPLKTSCIRITDQMLDALGGKKSKEYEEFKELCGKVYDILRRHLNTFVCLLSLIPTFKSTSRTSPNINEDEMFAELIKRFCPGEKSEIAIKNLKIRIDNSVTNSTLSKDYVYDWIHKLNKEKTVTNIIENTYEGTKTILSSMYDYLYFTS